MNNSVFIVDDNAAHRVLIRRALQQVIKTKSVVEASSIKEALILLDAVESNNRETPMLFLIDLNLGDGRGTELVQRIRANALYRDTPICMLSTSNLANDISDCEQAGVNAFIAKDDDATEFTETVATVIGNMLDAELSHLK